MHDDPWHVILAAVYAAAAILAFVAVVVVMFAMVSFVAFVGIVDVRFSLCIKRRWRPPVGGWRDRFPAAARTALGREIVERPEPHFGIGMARLQDDDPRELSIYRCWPIAWIANDLDYTTAGLLGDCPMLWGYSLRSTTLTLRSCSARWRQSATS